jgi:hypothetical protein
MRRGIVGSAVLHASILGATFVAWSSTRDSLNVQPTIIPVEMVDIADAASSRPEAREEPEPVEQPEEPVTPEATPAPEEQQVAAAEVAPPPPPQETEKPAEPAPKPPPPKPAPPKPNTNFDLDRIMANLDKTAPRPTPPSAAPRGERNRQGAGNQEALTTNIEGAMNKQMRECWRIDPGVPHPEQLIVGIKIRLMPDGHLAGEPELSADTRAAMRGNTYMRAAGEAALRAVRECEPYKLPPDRYAQWRELDLNFTPPSQ